MSHLEIKFNVSDNGIAYEELLEKITYLTSELIKNNKVLDFSLSQSFKTFFLVYTGAYDMRILKRFFSSFQGLYATFSPLSDCSEISKAYAIGEINANTVKREFLSKRAYLIALASTFKNNYLELNPNVFSILPIIEESLPNSKYVLLTFDGRRAVQNAMNNHFYTVKDPNDRITALDFPKDPYFNKWHEMSDFERVCWWWQKEDSILNANYKNDNKHIALKYEDLFDRKHYGTHIRKLCQFLELPAMNKVLKIWDKRLAKNDNQKSMGDFPHWKDWTDEQKEQFERIAGEHMREIGYSLK